MRVKCRGQHNLPLAGQYSEIRLRECKFAQTSFIRNYKEELYAFEETNRLLNAIIRVIGTTRDLQGFSQVSLLPFLMLMSRQGLNAFEAMSTCRSYQAWVSLRPSLECLLILGKWFDDPANAKIWQNREKDSKSYQKAYSGKALLSSSLVASKQIRDVLTRINDDFMHLNPRYYFRHTGAHPVDKDNIWIQVRFNDDPLEHRAHLYAFLHLTRFMVESLGRLLAAKYGEKQEFGASLEKVQNYFKERAEDLIRTNPESEKILTELGLWPASFFS